ncbi:hypothetical protein Xentx_02660 [Xenorhabdus thuongxuanensis]|uniref:Uncharacterized protein n=1 Tax=Xenorhabdus thuongxuanensis TaxID=1873484 RepID=A0A1Q5TX15_9GAMM|nr:hypothetical protein Xentx_02660 [Xenorhabdus thuongxuanensis]
MITDEYHSFPLDFLTSESQFVRLFIYNIMLLLKPKRLDGYHYNHNDEYIYDPFHKITKGDFSLFFIDP